MFKCILVLCCLLNITVWGAYKSNAPQLQVGEKPFWSNGSLYYVDMFGGTLHRYSLAKDKVYTVKVPGITGHPGFFVPIEDRRNRYVVGLSNAAIIIIWNGRSPWAIKERTLFTIPPNTNLNGLLISSQNDWYTGSYADSFCMAPPNQSVFQYLRSKTLENVSNNMGATVGMILIEKTNTIYHVDACLKELRSFKYNPLNGKLCKSKQLGRLLHLRLCK